MRPLSLAIGATVGYLFGRRQLRRVWRTAHHDNLTGLPDRSVMESTLKSALLHHEAITIALVDIDGLKIMNDKWGHGAGDRLISFVSNQLVMIVSKLPRGGFVARIGGDEFVMITTATPTQLERAYITATYEGSSSMSSVGISELHPCETVDHVLACADMAMYYAKRRHTPVVHYNPAMGDPECQRPTHTRQRTR